MECFYGVLLRRQLIKVKLICSILAGGLIIPTLRISSFLYFIPLFHSSNFGPGGNRTRYKNPAVDSLIEKGQYTMDEKKRTIFYRKAEEMIVEDSPWVFLWHRTDFTIRQPWVKNYKIYPIYSMDKGLDIEIK